MLYITQPVKQQIAELSFDVRGTKFQGLLLGFEKRDIRVIEQIVLERPATGLNTAYNNSWSGRTYERALQAAEAGGLSPLGILLTVNPGSLAFLNDYPYPLSLPEYSILTASAAIGEQFITFRAWRQEIYGSPAEDRVIVDYGNPVKAGIPRNFYPINYN